MLFLFIVLIIDKSIEIWNLQISSMPGAIFNSLAPGANYNAKTSGIISNAKNSAMTKNNIQE